MVRKCFLEKWANDFEHPSKAKTWPKSLSHNVSKITVFLHFKKKFKMAVKNGKKRIFGKTWQMILHIPCGPKILSKLRYLAPFSREMHFCALCRNFRWP